MQILIDIDKKDKRYIDRVVDNSFLATPTVNALLNAVRSGTPLPKGHGRLKDVDEIVKHIVEEYGVNSVHELPQDIKAFYDKFIASAPTVLDATFDYKLKNYACVKGVKE